MKMKSIAGLLFYVKDIQITADFYESLGFTVVEKRDDYLSIRLNWFWMDFHPQDMEDKQSLRSDELKPDFQKEANLGHKGAGMFVYISVEDVDDFYKGVLAKGLKPSSEPKDWPWGNREFVLRDPDGYKIVFFKRK